MPVPPEKPSRPKSAIQKAVEDKVFSIEAPSKGFITNVESDDDREDSEC